MRCAGPMAVVAVLLWAILSASQLSLATGETPVLLLLPSCCDAQIHAERVAVYRGVGIRCMHIQQGFVMPCMSGLPSQASPIDIFTV